jgi:N-acetylglucosaminyldiphosphoundecaprenol N-acetyl-beta-D-mannosaminyltransferase
MLEPNAEKWPPKFDVIGVQVSSTTYAELTDAIIQAALEKRAAVVSCHAVHAIVSASDDAELLQQVNSFEAVTPDGQPVRWALNWLHKRRLAERVYGPELTLQICCAASQQGIPVYLYGGTPAVLEKLTTNLKAISPGIQLSGEAPPFRPLTEEEDRAVIQRIADSGSGIVLIGLGCPKQDRFAYAHRQSIQAVQVCVGAAFDFHAQVKPMAPGWMQRNGLEWLYRLIKEPRRLWKRYLVTNTKFVVKFIRQAIFSRGAKVTPACE